MLHQAFSALISNAPFGVYLVDSHLVIVQASRAAIRTFGIDDLIGRDLGEALRIIWPLPFADEAIGRFKNTLATGESFVAKDTVERRADRDAVEAYDWRLERISITPDQHGVVCFFYDLTERQEFESKLRDSEEMFRTLAETIPANVFTADPEGKNTYISRHYEEFAGEPNATLLGDGWLDFVHPEDRKQCRDDWAASCESGRPFDAEYRLKRADGTYRCHLVRARPVISRSGHILSWVGAAIDVHDAFESRLALEQANETLERRVADALAERKLLADIVEETDAFVQVVDLNFRWMAINKASVDEFERIFGRRPAVGLSMLDLLADKPEHCAAVKAIWDRALRGEAFTEIGEFGDPALDRRIYEMKYNPLFDQAERRIGAYQFVYDVTERVQDQKRLAAAEDALRQSQKMETIGQLTGGVAHDFNNLLTPIVGALDALSRRLDDDPRARRLAANGLEAAERAKKMIERLLAFSRRQHLAPEVVDIARLVEGMTDMMRGSLGPRIKLRTEVCDGDATALVDPNQLELALLNLAVNARDAMMNGGTLHISVCRERVSGSARLANGDYVVIVVSDTGAGMDEATLARAVDPFFTTKGVGKGTGLGLSAVHGLAVQSGGDFTLDSRPGEGTTARLWLPTSTGQQQVDRGTVGSAAQSVEPAGGTILLIDDEELVRTGIAEMLVGCGYDVREAASGRHALAMLEDGLEVDAMVSDYAMPDMTGSQLASQVRKLHPSLPILLITGFSDIDDHDLNNFPRLSKPFKQADIARALAQNVHQTSARHSTRFLEVNDQCA